MIGSLFIQFVESYFSGIVGKIYEKFNGSKEEPTMLHKTMLTEEYSADLTWDSNNINHSIVAADVVSLDSSLPLKSRDAISRASGKLPKIGLKLRLGEKELSDINVMTARGAKEAEICKKIFNDVPRVIKATDVRKEIMFEQGLSTGMYVTESEDGKTGVRVDFGYKSENKFKCTGTVWGSEGAKPQDDLQQLFDKADEDSNTISHVYISKKYFNLFRQSEQGKLLYAHFTNRVITDNDALPVPGKAAFLDALEDEYDATFHIVKGKFKLEKKDGKKKSVRPWAEANIVGVPSEIVGRLVYGTLAEETNPVAGVTYEKSGSHVLVSKYAKTDPLEEFTAAQALCLPVIDDVDSVYLLTADKK